MVECSVFYCLGGRIFLGKIILISLDF